MRFLRSKKYPDIPDEELLEKYRRSPQGLYIEILFDRYCHLAFAVCMKYFKNEEDSKDAVIHIFERMHADLLKYRIENFSHWLYVISRNYCLKEIRNRKSFSSLDEMETVISSTPDAFKEEDFDLTPMHLQRLPEAMAELSREQMICIRLFYLEEKTYNEITAATGFTFKEVKSYIQNGKRNLRNYLEKKNGKA